MFKMRVKGVCSLVLSAFLPALGCQGILGITPGELDSTGGTGGIGGTGGTGGKTTLSTGGETSSSTGGGGESTTSGTTSTPVECGDDCQSTECTQKECVEGTCTITSVKKNVVLEDVNPGDCIATSYCNEEGEFVANAPFDADSDDKNDCTWDVCAAGQGGHGPKKPGTLCNSGAGICNEGTCQSGLCTVNQQLDGTETDVDCGGTCAAVCAEGKKCLANTDCATEFCASGFCKKPFGAGITTKPGASNSQVTLLTYTSGQNPVWTVTSDANEFSNFTHAAAAFDSNGEVTAMIRQGGGGRAARYQAGAWSNVTLWSTPTPTNYVPSFAKTGQNLLLFVQNNNFEHLYVNAAEMPLGIFKNVGDAGGGLSGAAVTRDGIATYYYAPNSNQLVETRYLVNGPNAVWSPAKEILSGNYLDGSPAAAAISQGTLIVAGRRDGNNHVLDWALIDNKGQLFSGKNLGPMFEAPKPLARRLALAARKGLKGGAVLALRNADQQLEVWLFEGSDGVYTWKNLLAESIPEGITQDPSVATGLGTAQAEVLWVRQTPASLVHSRILTDVGGEATWANDSVVITASGIGPVAVATP
ncbi:MAG: hypothetical protein IPK82_17910 [Polyangiaceae bacterium]|nr:hypothetical protein [Polyangiaceae bacterium]